jgi:hypothetical protein
VGVLPEGPFSQAPLCDGVVIDLPDRLPVLDRGTHTEGSGQVCSMEAASWLAGEKWSDHPQAVHRAIASVARWVNDAVDDEERQTLWPLILASLDTGTSHNLRLDTHLRHLTRKAGCKAALSGRPVQAWIEVLNEHARMTGHSSPPVPPVLLSELSEHLATSAGS